MGDDAGGRRMTASEPAPARRRYDSTVRRERAAETRERIIAGGADLLRNTSIRDWGALTIRAVAERAGVNERTVYRHFANERALRDAVMQRLEQQAGIDLANLRLEDIADVAARIFRLVSLHPFEPRAPLDPTLSEAHERQHDALLGAVNAHAKKWSPSERAIAGGMFDVLWSVGAYERLVVDWHLDREQAIRGISWVIGLVEDAIREGRRPT
jgi:AcrR family transcriptional regulator